MDAADFVIIGVNADKDIERGQKSKMKHKLNWPSFWNGPSGAAGPISKLWNVNSWPSTFLIDRDGVLVARAIHNQPFEELLATIKEHVEKR